MKEERLRQAARRAGEAVAQSLPEPEDCPCPFETEAPVRRRAKPWSRPAGRAACLLLLCLAGCGLWLRVDVQAWEILQGWVREQAAAVQSYVFAGEDGDVETGRYLLPWLPEGYRARSAYLADYGASLHYCSEAGQTLTFGYLKRDSTTVSSSISFHTGGMERSAVTVQGRSADFYQGDGLGCILVWQTRNTLFFLDGPLSQTELIALAEGVTYEP